MATGLFGKGGSFGQNTFSDFGGAVSDIFAGVGQGFKAQGAEIEKGKYLEAAQFASQNAEFTDISTRIKLAQQDRQQYQTLGGQRADVAGAGFAESGSALDLLRDSAAQGALTKQVTDFQGQITEAGYKEQASELQSEAAAAQVAEDAAKTAQVGDFITGGIKAVAGIATLF